jgi:hypothetical protein
MTEVFPGIPDSNRRVSAVSHMLQEVPIVSLLKDESSLTGYQ